jgi:glucose/arabinose dehydrogenase
MRNRARLAILAACLGGLLAPVSHALALGVQPVGTFDEPIHMASPPGDPRLFVVERPGYIQVMHDGVTSQFLDMHTLTTEDGERGLLSMAFDPNYASNGLFYVDYTGDGTNSGGAAGDIHIDEYHVGSDPNAANPATRRTVMTISHSSASNHNGGQLQFGKDGLLYISVGEAGNGANAQTLANPLGKILRIDPHGVGQGVHGVPPSNPFVGVGGATPEIWSLGLRNPFRFSFDNLTGDLIIADVGGGSREEVDFSPMSAGLGRGVNYGWPNCEGFSGFPSSCPGATAPVFDYPHSAPCNAIIGGFVYRGNQIPDLEGRYVYTDLCHPTVRSMRLGTPLASDDRSEGISGLSSPQSFGEDSSCNLYVTDGNVVDRIVGSTPVTAAPSCFAATATAAPRSAPTCKKLRRKHKKHAASAKKHQKKRCVKHKKRKKRRQRV